MSTEQLGKSLLPDTLLSIEYLPITTTIGLDAVVSKQLLTVNAIQRYIQHQQVAAIASLPGIEAQCIEYIAKKGSKIAKRPLRDIHFPKNAIVGVLEGGGDIAETTVKETRNLLVTALRSSSDVAGETTDAVAKVLNGALAAAGDPGTSSIRRRVPARSSSSRPLKSTSRPRSSA